MHGLDTMHRLNNLAEANQAKVQEINDEENKPKYLSATARKAYDLGFTAGHAEASQDNEHNTDLAYDNGSNDGYEHGYDEGYSQGQDEGKEQAQGPEPIREFLREAGIDPVEPVTVVWDAALKALVWTQGDYAYYQGDNFVA